MKRLLTVILMLVMLLTLVACGNDDGAPRGMMLASDRSKVDYSFYVPEEWTIDEKDTFSRAHAEDGADTSVAVFTFACAEDTELALWWTSTYKPQIEPALDKLTMLEEGKTGVIDKKASLSYVFTSEKATVNGENQAVITSKHQITLVKNGEKIYVIWYTSTVSEEADYYAERYEELEKILGAFTFSELEAPTDKNFEQDENAPEGMKLVSDTNIVLYSLYVPSSWIIDEQSAMTMAHVSDENKSSISVMQWNLTKDSATIDAWWENYHKKELSEAFDSLQIIEQGTEATLGGKEAKSYIYTVSFNGTTYKYYVTAAIDQGSIHIITYTSTSELYDETLTVVKEQILPNFKFN